LRQLPVKSLVLVSVFRDACRTLKSIFLNNKDAKNLKTISASTEHTDLTYKNDSFRDTVPLTHNDHQGHMRLWRDREEAWVILNATLMTITYRTSNVSRLNPGTSSQQPILGFTICLEAVK
jgi:hypothetical protein